MKMKFKSSFGFTLLEILFVISIIAVIATIGLTTMQQRAQKVKIEKTALQMQQILQAGLAYYNDNNNTWPNPPKPSFDPYIPINGKTSPWGESYTWGGRNKALFRVCTAPTFSKQMAERIASQLPNASAVAAAGQSACQNYNGTCDTESNTCAVATEVSASAAAHGGGSGGAGTIVAEGIFPSEKSFYETGNFSATGILNNPPFIDVTCSNGTAHMFASPYKLEAGFPQTENTPAVRVIDIQPICNNIGNNTFRCTMNLIFQSSFISVTGKQYRPGTFCHGDKCDSGHVQISYIAYCR